MTLSPRGLFATITNANWYEQKAVAGVMLIVALIVNNIPKTRKYPEFWF